MAEAIVSQFNIVSRAQAREAGANRYFTGKPCPKGHVVPRQISSGACIECMRIRGAEWREKNREKCRQNSRDDYIAKKEHYAALSKKWKKSNPEKRLENNRKWARENPEKVAEARKRWKRENPEKAAAQQLAMTHLRRARKMAVGGKHTRQEIAALKQRQRFKCACCGDSIKTKSHIDHIVPIALGGTNDILNIQILCPTCNTKKGKKHPIDWAQENGRLL